MNVPDAVADLTARQLPDRVRDAITDQADAARALHLARGPRYEEARQYQQTRIEAANKVLATVPGRQSLVIRSTT